MSPQITKQFAIRILLAASDDNIVARVSAAHCHVCHRNKNTDKNTLVLGFFLLCRNSGSVAFLSKFQSKIETSMSHVQTTKFCRFKDVVFG